MKRTILTYLACAAMAVVVVGWGAMADVARAQGCASCGTAAPVVDGGGAVCDTCGSCGSCATCGPCASCGMCGHPLLAAPLVPIRFVLKLLGGAFRCSGCGCETYYGDDWCIGGHGGCCEPCDNCGNYVGGCGRCGPGGIRGALFGGGAVHGGAVIDEPMAGGVVSGGDMVVGSNPSYNVAHSSGTCPTCGHSYANSTLAPRSNTVSTGSNASRNYVASGSANAKYNSGNGTANYQGNSSYRSNANFSNNANYTASRASYTTNVQHGPSPQVDLSSLPPGRFSPKVISVTDEVVSPANASAAADTQATRPRDAVVR